jgi:hypothetical protein
MVYGFLPHTECVVNKNNLKLGQNEKLVVVAFEPICMPKICFLEFLKFWFFYECLKILRRVNLFSKTQYAGNNFYCILSMRAIIFTPYSVCGQ